jgi:GGDEF domain-containing protein
MAGDPFLEEGIRVLTPEAFDFVLTNELKRALRSQNFLTLLVVEPVAQQTEEIQRQKLLREVAGLVSREVRETDLLAETREGQLSVVLLDSDLNSSLRVVDRLVARLENYSFPMPVAIEVGAACCPTHGADADTLRRAAEARPVHTRRTDRGNASNAQ